MNKFSENIKLLRIKNGFKTQQSFATAFGIGQTTIANWENGRREPSFVTMQKLAVFFKVSVDYLLGCQDDKQKDFMEETDSELLDLRFALYSEIRDLTEEDKRDLLLYARYLKSLRK